MKSKLETTRSQLGQTLVWTVTDSDQEPVQIQTKRILVIEDDLTTLALRRVLSEEGYAVTGIPTGNKALDFACHNVPDLIVLEVRLPDISGFDLCRKMRATGLRMPIIMLTVCAEEADKVLGLEIGADDYITKPYSRRELVARIRAQLRRASVGRVTFPCADTIVTGDLIIDCARAKVKKRGLTVWLTPIEFRLLARLAKNPGRVFTREQLLEAVWGHEADIMDARIVNTHICHLREKIEDDPAHPRCILTTRGIGYLFEPQD